MYMSSELSRVERHLWLHESRRVDLFEHGMLRIFERGQGCWLEASNGEHYFDLCSSMWQASLGYGYGCDEIVDAYAEHARKVALAEPIMFTTEAEADMAARLARVAPGALS